MKNSSLSVASPITQLEEKIKKLENENLILKNILDQIPSSIYWKDTDGTYLGRNTFSLEKMIEQGFEQSNDKNFIVGKTDYDLFPKEIATQFRENDLQVIQSGQAQIIEETFLNKTGKEYHHLSIKKPFCNEKGDPLGIVGMSIDITDRKEAEAREQQAAAKAAEAQAKANTEAELRQAVMVLAGSIAHDLRTPIAIIEMEAVSLKECLANLNNANSPFQEVNSPSPLIDNSPFEHSQIIKSLTRASASIQEEARAMHDYINVTLKTLGQVLKGELAKEDLNFCSMWHCIHNALTRYPFSAGQKELINWDQKDFEFKGNELLMIRIVVNLIKNSLEQINEKMTGQIFISSDQEGDNNILIIKDTAGGVSLELLPHLFTGYQTSKKSGTGVGLAFCKYTMKSFGGDIICKSKYGEYIEFILKFPKV